MKKTKRYTDTIVVHCSATPEHMDIGVKEISRWHKERGWAGCGYHYVINRDGLIELGRPLYRMGAHVRGHNANSIGICLVGAGKVIESYEQVQLFSLYVLIKVLLKHNNDIQHIIGHRDLDSAKPYCPGFDVLYWWHKIDEDNLVHRVVYE